MKNLYTLLVAVLVTATLWAQSPEKMSYQAVIRNTDNNLVTNTQIKMQISILQGTIYGESVYVETQRPTTNANGLVSIEIGNGAVQHGDFSVINWSAGLYFIKTETDPTGGSSYTINGTSQLLSVPYALHAKSADNFTGEITITETDPVFTAWDKTTGISITESQVSDLNHFTNSDESDPVYTQSVASGITAADISNWNNGQGSFSETDPIYLSSQASNITLSDITNLSNLSGINTGDQDLSGLATKTAVTTGLALKVDKVTGKGLSTEDYTTTEKSKLTGIASGAEVNVNADWNATSGDAQILNKPTIPGGGITLTIGQSYQGGIIFWLDATGQHGLIAATIDQSTGMHWWSGNGVYTITNAVRDGIGAGKFNTERIIVNQGRLAYAAQICANYKGGNYGDWYLPSKYELNLLYAQKTVIGGFADAYYWSSTEHSNYETGTNSVWLQSFTNGDQFAADKKGSYGVRAVRAF